MSQATDILKRIRSSDQYFVQKAKLNFALEIKRVMERLCVKNSEMADRLNVSRPMVTKLLRGDANLTIETMVKLARKLDGELHIAIVRNGCAAQLFEIVKAAGPALSNRAAAERVTHAGAVNSWKVAANESYAGSEDETQPIAA